MCGGPQEYITYEFVPASPSVSCMSGSSNLNSFRDRRQVAVQLVSWRQDLFKIARSINLPIPDGHQGGLLFICISTKLERDTRLV